MWIPPRPEPLERSRLGLLGFLRVADSWLDALTAKSYSMLLGHFWLPAMRVFIVNDPEWVERILIKEPGRYPKHRFMHEALEPLIGSSPFTTNGPLWQRQRKMLDQAFGAARLSLVFPLMQRACDDMIARLDSTPSPMALEVDAAMTHVTADIIYRTIFSEALQADEAATLFGAFAKYQNLSQKLTVLKLFRLPRLWFDAARTKQAKVIRDFLAAKVRARCADRSLEDERQSSDILAGLRLATDPEDGAVLSETELLDQICMLFLAGHETSASALSWCLYLLGESQPLQDKLRAELHEVAPDRALQPVDLRALVGLNAMFREALRLYPPVGYFPREALEAQEIRGVHVRQGDALLVFPWLLHRHRRWWAKPDAFLPERFIHDSRGNGPKGAYLPFGLGARACIGAGFATQEAALILGNLLKRYRLESVPGGAPRVVGRLTVRSDKGMMVRLRRLSDG